jgi:ribosomal protein S27AE
MNQVAANDLTIIVREDPNAMIFKGSHTGRIRAWICGECGYMDMFVGNPDELYAAYEKSKNV